MITEERIIENKQKFLDLVTSITREGVDLDRLVRQLENSDFFEAPASAIYHNAFMGGLCAHCLNVYYTLVNLCAIMYPDTQDDEGNIIPTCPYSDDTLKIVALFHDFDKMNKYERTVQNKKIYSETGTKYDEMGKYDWVSVPGYKRRDSKDVFSVGTHAETSVYMTETFIPLSPEEWAAITNHSSCYDNPKLDTTGIYSKYHLACLLHVADLMSTMIIES